MHGLSLDVTMADSRLELAGASAQLTSELTPEIERSARQFSFNTATSDGQTIAAMAQINETAISSYNLFESQPCIAPELPHSWSHGAGESQPNTSVTRCYQDNTFYNLCYCNLIVYLYVQRLRACYQHELGALYKYGII